MKALLALSLVSIIMIAGCSSKESVQKSPSQIPNQQSELTTGTSVEVTETGGESSTPKTYQVNIGEGIGIKQSS